jgi:hypothetical protein
MAKLIHSPSECGHRIGNLVCFHPDKDDNPLMMNCKPKDECNFPKKCPLENGKLSERYYGGIRSGKHTKNNQL